MRKREVQVELTKLVDEATALAEQVPRNLGRDVDRSEFVRELNNHHHLGCFLSLDDFEQVFTTIVLARYRYISDRAEEGLVSLGPSALS